MFIKGENMFLDEVKKLAKENKIIVFSDMDGVLAEFGIGEKHLILANVPSFYLNKRPIQTTLKALELLSKIDNVEIGIISNCHFIEQKQDKISWLKKNASFIKPENINIIVLNEETYTKETKDFLKINKILNLVKDKNIKFFLIEDDHGIIRSSNSVCPGVARHVSEIVE